MKPLRLYLRSRGALGTVALMLACAVGLWALGRAVDHPVSRLFCALLVAVAATTLIGPGLTGHDHDLDRTAALAWSPRRAAHLLIAGAVVFGLLFATALAGEQMSGAGQLVRNVAGLAGLVGLGAVTLGASRAALVPVVWTVLVLRYAPPLGEPPTRPVYKVMLTWLVQPAGVRAATVAAVILVVTGTLAYAVLGSRR